MNTNSNSNSNKKTAQKLLNIESKERLTSKTIGGLCDQPKLLKEYLDASITNTFSELMFRLTHEIYAEKKANQLWHQIVKHRENLKTQLNRDVGMLVASLDYLSNITKDLLSPKIIDDLRIEEAATMATRDFLTGLYLRGVFEFSLERIVQEHCKYNKPLALLLLDIDDFKHVNDHYGHKIGDEVLQRVGKLILKNIRENDLGARIGGEEIAIILPDTTNDQAAVIAERLREEIWRCFTINKPSITVSIGISFLYAQNTKMAVELVREADKALYKAKRNGKNKVMTFRDLEN